MRKFAWYGPTDRYPQSPGGGMCISVFVIGRRKGKILLGVPRGKRRWISEWIPAWGIYSKEDLRTEFRRWRLPSSYLLEGEHPNQALQRVMREQLQIVNFEKSSCKVLSYATPSDWYPGNRHWDLVFAYEVDVSGPIKGLPWWKELTFLGEPELKQLEFGWNDDMMRDLKLVE